MRIRLTIRHHRLELSSISGYSSSTCAQECRLGPKEVNTRAKQFDRKLTRMTVFISVAFICLSLPLAMRSIYYVCVTPTDMDGEAIKFLMYHISNKLFIANHAINFYLYCLSGAKFRNDFFNILKKPFEYISGKNF